MKTRVKLGGNSQKAFCEGEYIRTKFEVINGVAECKPPVALCKVFSKPKDLK